MPLRSGASVSENIKELHGGRTYAHTAKKFGKDDANRQAIAIALSTARRNKTRANGGQVNGYDDGGAVQSVIKALTQGGGSGGMFGSSLGGNNQTAPNSVPPVGTSAASTLTQQPATINNTGNNSPATAPSGVSPSGGIIGQLPASSIVQPQDQPITGTIGQMPAGTIGSNVQTQSGPSMVGQQLMPTGTPAPNGVAPNSGPIGTLMNRGGAAKRASGGFNMAKSPHLDSSWQTRQEARSMMHTGPILSAVPGRTDNHRTQVPSGSYVLPAQHIASMGQGNSVAGLSLAHTMFGGGGPYGAGAMKIGHGPGAPRPPRPGRFADGGGQSEGGARGEGDHVPVDVMLSGGEYVISPEAVRRIGKGSLKNGHAILDSWVMATRKKEIETQRKLPPPAKK